MARLKITNHFIILALIFGLFLVIVTTTKGQVIESQPWVTAVGSPSGAPPGGTFSGEFVHYYQADPRWNDACHYGWAICGPTSIAMIMSSLGHVVTPVDTDNIATRANPPMRNCGDQPWTGTTGWNRFFQTSFFTDPGFVATPISVPYNLTQMREYLDQGYLILSSVSIHIFVINDVDVVAGKVHLMDPARNNPAGYWAPAGRPWTGASGTSYAPVYGYAITRR